MKLSRGTNLGGYLSQCIPSVEHYAEFITEEDIKKISSDGFDHIRVPVDIDCWENSDGSVREEGYAFTDKVLKWAQNAGLDVIFDLHKAAGYAFQNAKENASGAKGNSLFTDDALQKRFINLWERNAQRYGKEPHLAFELLNEVVETESAKPWNQLIKKTVAAIRKYAPEITIIYGGICWNSVESIKMLEKIDDNCILTFHCYSPFEFTHQQAKWANLKDKEKIQHYPDEEQGWNLEMLREPIARGFSEAQKKGARLYCGEFGVFIAAPKEDTLRWFQDFDKVLREFDIGCAVWSYKRMGFGIYDEEYDCIREDILKTWIK